VRVEKLVYIYSNLQVREHLQEELPHWFDEAEVPDEEDDLQHGSIHHVESNNEPFAISKADCN